MSEEIVVALIGAAGTLLAAVVGAIATYRGKRGAPPPSADSKPPSYRFEIILVASAVVIAGVLIAGTDYLYGGTSTLSLDGVGGSWDRTVKPPKTYYYDDQLRLSVRRDRMVAGESTAEVRLPDGTIKKISWRVNGYLVGGLMSLSYGTKDPHGGGIGSYFLARYGDDYVGYIMVRDRNVTLRCPYATGATTIPAKRSLEQWKQRYPKLFDRGCEPVPLNPDGESPSP